MADMPSLVPLVEYPDFRAASDEARSLAINYGEAVKLTRSASGWTVLVSPSVFDDFTAATAAAIGGDDSEEDSSESAWDDGDDGYFPTKEDDDLISEFQDDQESYARSEDDGWFYED